METECRFCKGPETIRKGNRDNKSGKVQLYLCKSCGKTFSDNTTFEKMKHRGEIILAALDLYTINVSLRNIQKHLNQVYGVKVSHVSVLKWVRKYSEIFKNFTDKLKVNNSGVLHADEMMINIKGEWYWFWSVIDGRTKFAVSTHLSKTRDMEDTKKLFYEAKKKLLKNPERIITDGMGTYPRAIRKVFRKRSGVQHKKLIKLADKVNNNVIERYHGTLRERTKVMRAFKNPNSAKRIMDLMITKYNFLRPHQSLYGLTPAQYVGAYPNFKGENRWLEILKLAFKN